MIGNFYSVNNPDNPLAVQKTKLRELEHLFWQDALPEDTEDHSTAMASLATVTGVPRDYISRLSIAFATLRDLPQLEALQLELFHLDCTRLIAISNALAGINPTNLPEADRLLREFLTATSPNQVLPSAAAISRRIKDIRDMLDDARATGSRGTQDDVSFGVDFKPDGSAEVGATVDAVDGYIINEAVTKHAKANELTYGEAFSDILRNKIHVVVHLNLYSASDLAESPVWASGIGWLDAKAGQFWSARATKTRNMDEAAKITTDKHDPPPALRAAIIGRDGTCRFPGCSVPAHKAQVDHRIPFEEGGETSLEGTGSLCQHHHNMKTDGRINYLLDPYSGIIVWLMGDGTWSVTEPNGPLSPKNARWAQTVAQHRAAFNRRWEREK
ncbi:HNH endonuclease signature motif containing protein [Corynebacterium callunae]|uniref:HNH endonuclease signature motif containing protein n=1 Tax=Corynebacterium callunae TaxID=1721 RepID=UPI0039829A26